MNASSTINAMDITFEKCTPTLEDAAVIMEWRNDPETRAASYHSDIKILSEFSKEYIETFFNHPISPLFVKKDSKKIGFLKFSLIDTPAGYTGKTIDISINIAPTERKKGIGTETLMALNIFLKSTSFNWIIAEVKKNNIHSIQAFKKAGYVFLDEQIKHLPDLQQSFQVFRFIKEIK